jgi:hypothetical protein
MKTMKNWLPLITVLVVSTVFSQGLQEQLLTDKAHYLVQMLSKELKLASADFDGKFSINTAVSSGELVISL